MAFRSLAISFFILCFFFSAEVVNSLNSELATEDQILRETETQKTPDDIDLSPNRLTTMIGGFSTLVGEAVGLLESIGKLYDVVINSTVGFAEYFQNLLFIEDGTTSAILLNIIEKLVLVNHLFVIIQLVKSLGGNL